MKQTYVKPKAEKVIISKADVILTSFQVSASKQEDLGTTVNWDDGQTI